MSSYIAGTWSIAKLGLLKVVFGFLLCVDTILKSSNTFCWKQCEEAPKFIFFASSFSLNVEIGCVARPVFSHTLRDLKNYHLVDKSISSLLLILPIAFFTNLSSTDRTSWLMKILVNQIICPSVLLALPSSPSSMQWELVLFFSPHLWFPKVSDVLLWEGILATHLQPYLWSSS